MSSCYVPVCVKKKHNARKVIWFTKATVHWSNFCIFVDSSQIILGMICESKIKKVVTWEILVIEYCELYKKAEKLADFNRAIFAKP